MSYPQFLYIKFLLKIVLHQQKDVVKERLHQGVNRGSTHLLERHIRRCGRFSGEVTRGNDELQQHSVSQITVVVRQTFSHQSSYYVSTL